MKSQFSLEKLNPKIVFRAVSLALVVLRAGYGAIAFADYYDIARGNPLLVYSPADVALRTDIFGWDHQAYETEIASIAQRYCVDTGFLPFYPNGARIDFDLGTFKDEIEISSLNGKVRVDRAQSEIAVLGTYDSPERILLNTEIEQVHREHRPYFIYQQQKDYLPITFSRLVCFHKNSGPPVVSGKFAAAYPSGGIVFEDRDVEMSNPPASIEIRYHLPTQEITLGDLHGNALKLLYFLVREGIFKIKSDDYFEFCNIYEEESLSVASAWFSFQGGPVSDLDSIKVAKLGAILERIEVNPAPPKIRLIGDTLSDRGANDYFTLKIIKKLGVAHVPLEIILSNHDLGFIEFILNLSSSPQSLNPADLSEQLELLKSNKVVKPNDSLIRMVLSVVALPEIWPEINEIFSNYYLRALKVVSVSENPETQQFAYFSHAWTGLEAVEALAKSYEIKGCSHLDLRFSREMFKFCVTQINQKFRDELVTGDFPSQGIMRLDEQSQQWLMFLDNSFLKPNLSKIPLLYSIWNRGEYCSRREGHIALRTWVQKIEGHSVHYLFGHVGEDAPLGSGNLDTHLGKSATDLSGNYRIYRF